MQVLAEDIVPALDKLRKEKGQYMEWQAANANLDRQRRFCVAYHWEEKQKYAPLDSINQVLCQGLTAPDTPATNIDQSASMAALQLDGFSSCRTCKSVEWVLSPTFVQILACGRAIMGLQWHVMARRQQKVNHTEMD